MLWPFNNILPWLETFLSLPLGRVDLVFFEALTGVSNVRTVAPNIASANGVAVSADGSTLAIASTSRAEVLLYSKQKDDIKYVSSVRVPFAVDNLAFAGDQLLAAGHPYIPELMALLDGKSGRAPSYVTTIAPRSIESVNRKESWLARIAAGANVTTIFTSDGSFLSSSSGAFVDLETKTMFVVALYGAGVSKSMFMKPFALFFAAAAALSVSGLSVDTPAELTQCGTVEIKWSGKKSPFILSVLPSCESDSEDPLLEFTGLSGTSYKWTVNLPSSTGSIAFAITDGDGNEAYSEEVVIKQSDNTACLSAASSSAATSGAAATSTAVVSDADSLASTTVSVSSTPVPSAPVNVGAGLNPGTSSESEIGSSSSKDAQTQANSAVAPVISTFASITGVAAVFVILF
ncbi:unnamed protein product [Rhizoctonia solani]|nr:unnamed protein product [Rhizoctonia solani]CAE6505542.1 unnamed protein product [Rhizoctonia solani]